MSDGKIRSEDFVSDEELWSVHNQLPGDSDKWWRRRIADLAINAYAVKVGAVGRRVEGVVLEVTPGQNKQFNLYTTLGSIGTPATLFIHESPKPRRTDAERIREALDVLEHVAAIGRTHGDVEHAIRILRGEGE